MDEVVAEIMRNPPKPSLEAKAPQAPRKRPYQPPRVMWREPYEPTSFGISCAKQPGNPGCNPGPVSS
jgi:hypothetical protein